LGGGTDRFYGCASGCASPFSFAAPAGHLEIPHLIHPVFALRAAAQVGASANVGEEAAQRWSISLPGTQPDSACLAATVCGSCIRLLAAACVCAHAVCCHMCCQMLFRLPAGRSLEPPAAGK
jgi:hypothetical protein